jgi:hypothetical protein
MIIYATEFVSNVLFKIFIYISRNYFIARMYLLSYKSDYEMSMLCFIQ